MQTIANTAPACRCDNCPGAACNCGCQHPPAPQAAACACGPNCACQPACRCA